MDSTKLNFEESNSVDLLYNDDDVIIASIDLFYVNEDGDCNRNRCNISRESAEKSLKTFKNKPIIFRYDSQNPYSVTDFTEHSKNSQQEFQTRIAGHIPSDSRIKFITRDNGKTYCNVEAVIQKKYLPQLVDILKKNKGEIKVSMEINAYGEQKEDDIFYINKFVLQGVCLLGKYIDEGIEGSHLEVLKFSKSEMDKYNKIYLEFSKQDNIYSKIKNSVGISMEDNEYGKGSEIKIDKSPESISYDNWGEIDKIDLRNKVLNAKNYKELVHEVYMQVEDGWEEAPSEKLKYPVMQIKGDTAVYNRYGLASALGYAKADNNTMVVNKVEELYKTINLDKEDKMKESENLLNKLDTDNPELEKMRDDADAMEDNVKEKLDNAVVDAPENEKLKDDIDSDKDYWKNKFSELEKDFNDKLAEFESCKNELEECKNELNSCKNDLQKYVRKEDIEDMKVYLDTFKSCFTEDEYEILTSKINETEKVDFEKMVDEKIKDFAKKFTQNEMVNIKNSSQGNIVFPQNQKQEQQKTDVFDNLKEITIKYN